LEADTLTSSIEQPVYERMWAEAAGRFARGQVQVDQHLLRRAADRRTGITLIARPSAATIARVGELVAELRGQEPGQYYYRPDELHITVLTLVSASESFALGQAPIAAYQAALGHIFEHASPFRLHFRGVSASPGAVVIQGYADGDRLNLLREPIRQALARAGLAGGLDTRYRIVTAHTTFMRFQAQPADLARLARQLRAARERDFGSTLVERIEFVANDWYMSHDRVQVLAAYHLGENDHSICRIHEGHEERE